MKTIILMPVYNDWDTLWLLAQKIKATLPPDKLETIAFVIVDDGSEDPPPQKFREIGPDFEIIRLIRNMGHQKAIAIGLSFIAENRTCEAVIIMDSDGEDEAAHIEPLIKAYRQGGGKIIFAKRTKRHEGIFFKIFYYLYKFVFYVFTGRTIEFGNFCIIPSGLLKRLVYLSEIWNHFPSAVVYSRLKYETIALPRGKRLAGKSKMNYSALLLHGFSAMAVHIEVIVVRLLMTTLGLIGLCGIGIVIVLVLRFLTDLAVPGWATSTLMNIGIILLQSLLISLVLLFVILTYRMQRLFIPATHYREYIQQET